MFLIYLAWCLPLSRFSIPRVVVMYSSVTILTALAILLQIISSNLVYEERLYSPPRMLFKFFFDNANPILKLDVYKLQVNLCRRQVEKINNQDDDDEDYKLSLPYNDLKDVFSKEWLLISAGIDRLGFGVYTLI